MTPTGVSDLSVVTDKLLGVIRGAINAAGVGYNFNVSGAMPESVRGDAGCQVSFYLYYTTIERSSRNSPATGSPLARQRPLGLELYYLLTSHSGKEYTQEQQTLAIAMRALQDNPYLRMGANAEEMTVTLEMESVDKLGLLWQAVSAPFRLGAIYKVGIVFLAPTQATPPPAPRPTAWTVVAEPSSLPFADAGQLLGSYARVTYLTPESTPASPKTAAYDLSPAAATPGGELTLLGAGLNTPTSNRVYLLDADGSNERDVTAWRAADAALQTGSRIALTLPAAAGAAPAGTPDPGVYQVRAGGAGPERTNAVPLGIGAAVTGVANPPILAPAGGLYTIAGAGFVAGRTELLLDTIALEEAAGAPGAGQFQVQGGTAIAFRAPSGLAPGRYPVRVRVNGLESAPSWWITP